MAAMSWTEILGDWLEFEAVYERAVAGAHDGARFIEVGCYLGASTCCLAQKIKAAGKRIRVYAIDHCLGSTPDAEGAEKPGEGWDAVRRDHGGNTATALLRNIHACDVADIVVPILTDSRRAAELFAPGSIDFAFIDGGHHYDGVRSDLESYWPLIRPGGLFAGHDYCPIFPGLIRAVDEFFPGAAERPAVPCSACWSVVKPC